MLTDLEIENEIIEGNIFISPFNRKNLKNTMYDITLGKFYYLPKQNPVHKFNVPYSQESIDDYYGPVQEAISAHESLYYPELAKLGILPEDQIIIVPRNQVILCHTQEFIGGIRGITTHLSTRSTLARCGGIRLCCCAGLGDVGFYNRWALEVENPSEKDVVLTVGKTIGSVTFYRIGECLDDYSKRGKYSLKSIQDWDPKDILPKGVNT